jgi:hypothetical protein
MQSCDAASVVVDAPYDVKELAFSINDANVEVEGDSGFNCIGQRRERDHRIRPTVHDKPLGLEDSVDVGSRRHRHVAVGIRHERLATERP